MTEVHREIEATLVADDAFDVPSLLELVRSSDAATPWVEGEPATQVLRATYYDTDDLALARHGLTLRRRAGGSDSGWHLKVPDAGAARSEVRLPPGRAGSALPEPLRRMVRAQTLDRPLVPVAKVTTRRTVRRLFDATDRPVLELADDRVSARRVLPLGGTGAATGPEITWRELEVEALDDGTALVDVAAAELVSRGLRPAPHTSKVAHVLGLDPGSQAGDDGGRSRRPAKPARSAKAARAATSQVPLAYVRDQVEQLRTQDLLVRLDAPGSVHKMRVATRRLRSALVTYRKAFDRDALRPLLPELKWFAGVLGAVRDAEVMRERVVDSLQGPSEHLQGADAGPDRDPDLRPWDDAHAAARAALLVELDGERYGRLLHSLERLVTDPAVPERGRRPARKVLRRGVAREYADVRRLVRRATTVSDEAEREDALHDARKAAKRARYAAELATAVFGDEARAFAAAMESTQEVLGRHQDSVVLRERLRDLAASATDPMTAFDYGRLHALEQVRAREAEDRLPSVWRKASRKRLRRWLR
ncbi:CYTH and CHAD domain-containing protein [Cellulomonas sp. NS3]|uniref:CYTH and CHAD domain-containing protein n=1 Tax=Cellulomonas sp. NS3 TaxID=2973977 RepID=UPI002163C1FD|nr:CYTH and CHAD domain-containing protein [Cellulomonas sp. NS3]